jgi:hypothetical protein
VLVAWSKASQDCLDFHKINAQAIDTSLLTSIFPNSDGSGASANGFVGYLRFNEGAAVNGIRLSLTDFFTEGSTSGTAVLKDSIVVNGQTYDCKASASDCWNNGLKVYFSQEPGLAEMQVIGAGLYDRLKYEAELEQATVRIAICNSGGDVCEPLKTEIEDMKASASGCAAFGLGPAENSIPGCSSAPSPSQPSPSQPSPSQPSPSQPSPSQPSPSQPSPSQPSPSQAQPTPASRAAGQHETDPFRSYLRTLAFLLVLQLPIV